MAAATARATSATNTGCTRVSGASTGMTGLITAICGDLVEEVVVRAEHHGGPQDHRARGSPRAPPLRPRAFARPAFDSEWASAPMPEMNTNGSMPRARGGFGGQLRALGVDHREQLARPLSNGSADGVDHRFGADQRPLHGLGDPHIGLHDLDLADIAQQPRPVGLPRPAHGDADAPALLGQRPHGLRADEPGAAEHGDEAAHADPSEREAKALR